MISRMLDERQGAKQVAASFAVNERTVRKWLGRYHAGRLGIENAASAPHTVANKLPRPWSDLMARLRRTIA